jgi:fatty acid desaturase
MCDAVAEQFDPDAQLRLRIRRHLPPEIFRPQPARVLYALVLIAAIIALSVVAAASSTPSPLRAAAAVMLGNSYASLMFFAHEVAHGAVVRRRWMQNAVLYAGGAIFCLSPHLWRQWHNGLHHPQANVVDHDPDNFGTYSSFARSSWLKRLPLIFAPGSSSPASLLYLPCFFTLQAQAVLWYKSRGGKDFARLRRARAAAETAVMAGGWIALACSLGWPAAAYVVVIPMLVANTILLGYVLTNHLLRQTSDMPHMLATTMSVRTLRVLDLMHFHFSHHIEHHLFPSLASNHYPEVRRALLQLVPKQYLAPSHWRALLLLFATPRLYDGHTTLVDTHGRRKVRISSIEELLREL